MSSKLKSENQPSASYVNRAKPPFPESTPEKVAPPVSENELPDNKSLFEKKIQTPEEVAIGYMSEYKRFERVIVCNFYTGGSAYSRGILDSIYRGFNPLNPNM